MSFLPQPAPLHIISGGQTGVDRAALDFALETGWPHGGWCPLGRLAEDGFIPVRYRLRQTEVPQYAVRTERNVMDATATLIMFRGELTGGTELTKCFCRKYAKPVWLLEVTRPPEPSEFLAWLQANAVNRLNVAGPRESSSPGIHDEALQILRVLFAPWLTSVHPAASSDSR